MNKLKCNKVKYLFLETIYTSSIKVLLLQTKNNLNNSNK